MLLSSVLLLTLVLPGGTSDVTRDFFGDIFRLRDCHNGSRCDNGGRRAALPVPGRHCYCQCAPSQAAYREDKQQCVKDIKECYMSVFYRPFTVEAIPLVYLPTSGQLVHPDAHLSLSMRRNVPGSLAKCRVTVSQYLTREGWRTITRRDSTTGGPIFDLYTDGNKTYLQFLGSPQDRKLLQQHLALIRMLCVIPQYPAFETCVAIRVGWVPGLENIDDAPVASNKANMMVVGLSLGVLALVYIFAVLVYLKIRRQMISKQKTPTDQEAKAESGDDGSDKTSSLHRLEASSRLGLYHTASLGRQKHGKESCEKWAQMSPIVETYNRTWTDRMGLHGSEFRAQDFKLQPEYFEPEFMASPPHEVLEYLERLQNSVTFARHRMRTCYRYQPTLNGIPEDDYFYQDLDGSEDQKAVERTTPDGGSASSVMSLQESSPEQNNIQRRELPKIPPRKPRRKTKERSPSSAGSAHSSDQEQKEIQKAMNTLNDTLDALEYDIYKQEILMNHASDSENANLSCQNSTSLDFDEFETSSCSSLSVATVLGRDAKRQSDISKCSQYIEKNQSEDFSTFSNTTYSLNEAMRGLFNSSNKASSLSDISNISSQCSSSPNGAMRGLFSDSNRATSNSMSDISNRATSNSMSDISNISSRCSSRARSVSRSPFPQHQKMNIPEEVETANQTDENIYADKKLPNKEPENGNQQEFIRNPSTEKADDSLLDGPPLRKSPSSESLTTVATDMTTDSLDSRCSSPDRPSPTPSLMEMWINKLVTTSVPYSKNRRKSKKKLVLPENDVEGWEHVCQKHKDPCPLHDLNDSEPNLIDKLAHYGSKTMSGCDVAGYFQSLKQDVLKEHLRLWLGANSQRGKGVAQECSHKKPLVNGQVNNVVAENGMHICGKANRSSPADHRNNAGKRGLETNETKSIQVPSSENNANENRYYEKKEKCVQT